jgi:LmbE family N-acetylglucosaminyl deacetylase
LGASQTTTDILDSPYRAGADGHDAAVRWIEAAVDELDPERIAIPLGTEAHEDHVMTRVAAITATASRRPSGIYLYADLPYFFGSDSDAAARALNGALEQQSEPSDDSLEKKRAAVAHYHSQVQLLADSFGTGFDAVFQPGVERLYRVEGP